MRSFRVRTRVGDRPPAVEGDDPPGASDSVTIRTPRVSAAVITRNRPGLLVEAIESALAQRSEAFELEVIVVDDGSTDETPTLLQRYDVRVVRLTGVGLPAARNAAMAAATGDYFTVIDDDDVWMLGAFEAMVAALEASPRYAAVHGRAQLTHFDLTPFGDVYPPLPLTSGALLREMLAYFPQHAMIMTRMDIVRQEGGLDVSLGWADWDWVLRIAARHEILRIETPVLLFRQRDVAEEEKFKKNADWVIPTFRRHTPRSVGLVEAVKLRRTLWRHRGWMAVTYLRFAKLNWQNGDRGRAARSTWYAFLSSAPHTVLKLIREWPFPVSRGAKTQRL